MEDYRNPLIYDTQAFGIRYVVPQQMLGYPYSWARKRRTELFRRFKRNKDLPYMILRVFLRILYFSVMVPLVCLVAYFVSDVILGLALGYLIALLWELYNDWVSDIGFDIDDELFIRRK